MITCGESFLIVLPHVLVPTYICTLHTVNWFQLIYAHCSVKAIYDMIIHPESSLIGGIVVIVWWPGEWNQEYECSLTHWGRVMHMCISKLTITGLDNRLLFIRTLATKFSEMLSKIHTFSICKMHLKASSTEWRQFCLGLNVLRWLRYNCARCERCNASGATVATDSSLNIYKYDTSMAPQLQISRMFSPAYSPMRSTYALSCVTVNLICNPVVCTDY